MKKITNTIFCLTLFSLIFTFSAKGGEIHPIAYNVIPFEEKQDTPAIILTKEEVKNLINNVEKPAILTKELLLSKDQEQILEWFSKLERSTFEIFKSLNASPIDSESKEIVIEVLKQYYKDSFAEMIFNVYYSPVYSVEGNYYDSYPMHAFPSIEVEKLLKDPNVNDVRVELLSGSYYYDLFISGTSTDPFIYEGPTTVDPNNPGSVNRIFIINNQNFLIHAISNF
ncbi:hypothetical protein [Chengkuizengella axinellae]|uniref:Uncharacterized protein n=1 Tax=Chengkuizengella axinellae TaxID=3064388 RepID=A0ABT9J0U3_9BACL|nr:hypothetical protein [Chengkuizengella sp. 2205SS18-9]MDP5275202.1 hypothetical protein [Chengkuizengella sp. 2205SS18-9]